ncbi:HPP family protein [Azoarcus sp. PA01]|nr:HPP family protein [Azoarcus sp. PA01]
MSRPRTSPRRLGLRGEMLLALLPTLTVLAVLGLVQMLSDQRLLFASLASSAFLIYLEPEHATNRVTTLVVAQMSAAGIGLLTYVALGPGYVSAGIAMVAAIVLMIVVDAVHPPAVSTALSFALRAGDESNIAIFGLAVVITALLVALQRAAVWMLRRYRA